MMCATCRAQGFTPQTCVILRTDRTGDQAWGSNALDPTYIKHVQCSHTIDDVAAFDIS